MDENIPTSEGCKVCCVFCTVMFDVCVKIASYTHVFVLNLNHVQNNNTVYNMFYLN
jgi:hypothetical protein